MLTDSNAAMTEALRLTQAGQLAEATTLLQRGLAGGRDWMPRTHARPSLSLPNVHAAPAIHGLLDRLDVKLPDLSHVAPAMLPGRGPAARPGAAVAAAAAAPGGEIRHLTHTEPAGT